MRDFLGGLAEYLPVSLIPYLIFGGGLLFTAFCFVVAYILNRK